MIRIFSQLLSKNDQRYIRWKKSLKNRPPPWNKGKNKNNDLGVKKISDTLKTKKIDNFKIWRENAKKLEIIPNSKKLLNQDEDLAFLTGLILGDGHLAKASRTEVLRITLGTDKPNLWKYAAKIVNRVFNKKPNIRKRKHSEAMDITIYQNNLAKRLFIPLGPKRKYKLKLPTWIWNNKIFLISALKGLFEAEGSFSIHLKTCTYNFAFRNFNTSLLLEVKKALILFGYHPEERKTAIRLRKRDEALSFKQLIKFRTFK
ncbi:MAG: hypothetical protein UR56_C0002G0065 [Candidatus Roizmanbacteria bacterium GW2011_GWC2_34_23]|uniref:DOD-type homing endonuclease domain-containing protein n=1 Tax=Candidatus Roizmanbacteria bacterium GW2011_GWC2_34_23 TaxID=1618484 RepID=A0A0G0B118_9BACT|nr:MAG: hypothetical protein UR56_C0002G0065 [Candidatus Roizmanbacteria bacterium GW2011_GWC2_34_23]